MHWEDQKWLGSTSQWHPYSHASAPALFLSYKFSSSQPQPVKHSRTHLKTYPVDGVEQSSALLGHENTCPSSNSIPLGGSTGLIRKALYHRPSSAISRNSKNIGLQPWECHLTSLGPSSYLQNKGNVRKFSSNIHRFRT